MTDGAHTDGQGALDASDQFVRRTASALASAGFPRMPANVMMTLMGSGSHGLTAQDLSDRLGVSAAAISGAVRYLDTVGMVRRHREPGDRRYFYELAESAWYTVSFNNGALYDYVVNLATDELARLDPASPAYERVEEMADFLGFIRTALPRVLDEWMQQRRAARG